MPEPQEPLGRDGGSIPQSKTMTILAVLAVQKGRKILDTFKENENDGFGGSDPYPIFGCFWEEMGDPCLQTGKDRVAREN